MLLSVKVLGCITSGEGGRGRERERILMRPVFSYFSHQLISSRHEHEEAIVDTPPPQMSLEEHTGVWS